MVTAAAVHAVLPPVTVGAVGATVSTRHLSATFLLVPPFVTRTVKVCKPCFSLV